MSLSRNTLRRSAVGSALILGASAASVLAGTPAQAAAAPVPASTCLIRTSSPHRAPDSAPVSASQARALQRVLDQAPVKRSARGLPTTITIPVRAHILRGTHAGDNYPSYKAVYGVVDSLNKAYSGREDTGTSDPPTANTRYRFRLYSRDTTRNDSWYHVSGDTPAARSMKNHLHLGFKTSLNLYFVKPSRQSGFLGYSSFPWNYSRSVRQDGVVINFQSINGGGIANYNQGDTAVHEIGHWLGLFHTFQNGCDTYNDGVTDTPAESDPTFGCPQGKDTCTKPSESGLDPIHNFMDYSYDSCMYQFTPEQSTRLDKEWAQYRS